MSIDFTVIELLITEKFSLEEPVFYLRSRCKRRIQQQLLERCWPHPLCALWERLHSHWKPVAEGHPLEESASPEVKATEKFGSEGISMFRPTPAETRSESAERMGLAQELGEGSCTGCSSREQAGAEQAASCKSGSRSRSRCPLRRSSAVFQGTRYSEEDTQPQHVESLSARC